MDVGLFEPRRIDPEIGRTVLDDAECRLRTLAHHLAELTGEDQSSPTGHARCLDEQDITADRRPGKARCHTRNACPHRDFAFELGSSQYSWQVIDADWNRSAFAFGDAHGGVAQRLADLAFKAAHARFARVPLDDLAKGLVGDLDLFRLETVRFHLATNEITARDF